MKKNIFNLLVIFYNKILCNSLGQNDFSNAMIIYFRFKMYDIISIYGSPLIKYNRLLEKKVPCFVRILFESYVYFPFYNSFNIVKL
jgi:hypothetical protein